MPVSFHLDTDGIVLGVCEDRCEPIGQQTELPNEKGEVFRRYKLKMSKGSKLGHAWRRLDSDLEIFGLVEIVGKGSNSTKRMRVHDDVYELELRR